MHILYDRVVSRIKLRIENEKNKIKVEVKFTSRVTNSMRIFLDFLCNFTLYLMRLPNLLTFTSSVHNLYVQCLRVFSLMEKEIKKMMNNYISLDVLYGCFLFNRNFIEIYIYFFILFFIFSLVLCDGYFF